MQLTIVLPDEIGERVRRLPDPSRFIAEILSKALSLRSPAEETAAAGSETSEAPQRVLPQADRARWLSSMRAALDVDGQALAIEEVQALSRKCALDGNELSRSVIEAREP